MLVYEAGAELLLDKSPKQFLCVLDTPYDYDLAEAMEILGSWLRSNKGLTELKQHSDVSYMTPEGEYILAHSTEYTTSGVKNTPSSLYRYCATRLFSCDQLYREGEELRSPCLKLRHVNAGTLQLLNDEWFTQIVTANPEVALKTIVRAVTSKMKYQATHNIIKSVSFARNFCNIAEVEAIFDTYGSVIVDEVMKFPNLSKLLIENCGMEVTVSFNKEKVKPFKADQSTGCRYSEAYNNPAKEIELIKGEDPEFEEEEEDNDLPY
jgi:hypothetical protein